MPCTGESPERFFDEIFRDGGELLLSFIKVWGRFVRGGSGVDSPA